MQLALRISFAIMVVSIVSRYPNIAMPIKTYYCGWMVWRGDQNPLLPYTLLISVPAKLQYPCQCDPCLEQQDSTSILLWVPDSCSQRNNLGTKLESTTTTILLAINELDGRNLHYRELPWHLSPKNYNNTKCQLYQLQFNYLLIQADNHFINVQRSIFIAIYFNSS